jgi:HlyD family secretion protein
MFFGEKLMRIKLPVLALVMISLLIAVSLVACSGSGNSSTAPPTAKTGSQNAPPGPPGGGPGPLNQPPPAKSTPAITAKIVSGDGTISVSNYANLYFGSAGQIDKISVHAGDRVNKGMILAHLDTTSLEATLSLAQVTLNQAQLAQSQSKVNLDQAQISLVQTGIALDQAYLTQTQALSSLAAAQFALNKVKAVSDIKDIITNLQQHIAAAEVNIRQMKAAGNVGELKAMNVYIQELESEMAKQQNKLSALLSTSEYAGANSLSYDVLGQTYDRLTVEDARMKQLAVETAQKVVDQSKSGIELAQKNIDKARDSIALAQLTFDKSYDTITLAQKNTDLLKAQITQATIIAPFDGIIAEVNRDERDFVSAPAQMQKPVLYLVDLTTLQLDISVNELDMPQVKLDQKARISIDAYPALAIDGRVSRISLLPDVQGGIVDYNITITFPASSTANVMIGMHASASVTIE